METVEMELMVEGMGAVVNDSGVYFRVWAPNATKLFVMGSFNSWSPDRDELSSEGNGYWGVNVESAKNGDEYKFVIHNGDRILIKNDPYAKQMINSNGNCVVYENRFNWGEHSFEIPSWNELIIYELHIGTFNAKEPGKPGNFYSAIERIPYLLKAGINAVEIMPPYEFAGGYSWGYNPSQPFAIETEYGGPDGLKEFVKQCHANGIAVILDVVYNHLGPGDLDMWQFDGWSENDKGGIYFYNDDRSHTPWGDTRPDYGRPEVRTYFRDNALMWLDEFKVDGLRFDAVSYITNVNGERNPDSDLPEGHELIKWINAEIREKHPGKIIIAEDMKNCTYVTGVSEDGGLAFNAQWDPGFVHNVRHILSQQDDQNRDMNELEKALLFKFREDCFSRIIYTESHDETANGKTRVSEEITPGDPSNWFAIKRSMLGLAFVLTAPGIPMLFQGQLKNEGGWFSDQQPIDWEGAKSNIGLVQLAADLINLRKNKWGISKGLTGQFCSVLLNDNERKIFVFHRYSEDEAGVIVALNFSNQHHEVEMNSFPSPQHWKLRFNSDDKKYNADFAGTVSGDIVVDSNEGKFIIGPYTCLVYSCD